MKLVGGRARLSGISFYTDSTITMARIDSNGRLSVQQTSVKANKWLAKLRKIPFIRGIVNLLSVMLDNRLFLTLFIVCLVPWDKLFGLNQSQMALLNFEIPDWVVYSLFILMLIGLRLRLAELWRFHGAEHKAVNAYNKHKPLTLEEVRQESRIAANCGTNLMLFIYFVIFLLAWPFGDHDVLLLLCAISLGYELFKLNPAYPFLRPFYTIGGLIQKYLVTSEPQDSELEIAILALRKAMEVETEKLTDY